jgi:hypothetical protein
MPGAFVGTGLWDVAVLGGSMRTTMGRPIRGARSSWGMGSTGPARGKRHGLLD